MNRQTEYQKGRDMTKSGQEVKEINPKLEEARKAWLEAEALREVWKEEKDE